jgi:hypothetical protein
MTNRYTNMPPVNKARAFNRLWAFLPSLADRFEPEEVSFLLDALAMLVQYHRHHLVEADFELHADGRCSIGGTLLPKDGRGLALAWFVLCLHQTRQPPPRADWIFQDHKRPGVCAKNALDRAALQVEGTSRALASAIRAIGTEGGHLVLKHRVAGVRCTSEALAEACST